MKDMQKLKDLDRTLRATREKVSRLKKKLAILARELRYDDEIKAQVIDEYLEVNEQLKAAKIWEAQFCYDRNKL